MAQSTQEAEGEQQRRQAVLRERYLSFLQVKIGHFIYKTSQKIDIFGENLKNSAKILKKATDFLIFQV